MTPQRAVALDLDGVLGDTRRLWDDWLASTSSVLGVDAARLPADRGAAAAVLDRDAGNWRSLLDRFAEERVAVYIRRDPATSDAIRVLAASGCAIGVFTDAPRELARVALSHLGADRRVAELATGAGALERLLARWGPETAVLRTRDELLESLAHGNVGAEPNTRPAPARRS